MKAVVSGLMVLALAACASVAPARMTLPPALLDAAALPVTGIGGGNQGTFAAGAYGGSFERSETRLDIFDPLIEQRRGGTRFTIHGPGISGTVQVSCRMRERTLSLSVFSIEAEPMAQRCTLEHEGRVLPARFEIQSFRQGLGGMMQRAERRGEIAFGGVILSIRSVHDLEGTSLQLATPIGYAFEQDGAPVGAVELTGAPVVWLRPQLDPATRQVVLIAAIALGLFRDPAASALGREAG
jgi:hypothetical protein